MQYAMRSVGVLSVVASMMLGLGMTQSQAVSAVAPPACAAELGIQVPSVNDASTQTRVLTVHGLGGDDTTFDAMEETLKQVGSIKIDAFDYKSVNDRWVTDPAIGQRLAKYIVCYSLLYKQRPVVVTHSMGALAAREALDWAAYGVFAKNALGHLVTIAPPHTGALPANIHAGFWLAACKAPFGILSPMVNDACRQIESTRATSGLSISSDQLDKLAKFPPGVSVKTIAGDVSWTECAPWGCSPAISTGGDLVVSVASATAYYTSTGKGDGKTVFTCDTGMPVGGLSTAWCEHSNMLRAPQVQAEVKKSIEQYIASTRVPTTTAYNLQLRLTSGWQVATNTEYTNASRTTLVNTATCKYPDYPPSCSPVAIVVNLNGPENMNPYGDPKAKANNLDCYSDKLHEDATFGSPKMVEKLKIGGEDAVHEVLTGCASYSGGNPGSPTVDRLHIWRIPARGVLVYTSLAKDISRVEDLLRSATWK